MICVVCEAPIPEQRRRLYPSAVTCCLDCSDEHRRRLMRARHAETRETRLVEMKAQAALEYARAEEAEARMRKEMEAEERQRRRPFVRASTLAVAAAMGGNGPGQAKLRENALTGSAGAISRAQRQTTTSID